MNAKRMTDAEATQFLIDNRLIKKRQTYRFPYYSLKVNEKYKKQPLRPVKVVRKLKLPKRSWEGK